MLWLSNTSNLSQLPISLNYAQTRQFPAIFIGLAQITLSILNWYTDHKSVIMTLMHWIVASEQYIVQPCKKSPAMKLVVWAHSLYNWHYQETLKATCMPCISRTTLNPENKILNTNWNNDPFQCHQTISYHYLDCILNITHKIMTTQNCRNTIENRP